MRIRKERTRLIFTEYTEFEKLKLDKLVGTDDRVFWYNDPDDNFIAFAPGMEETIRQAFPKIPIEDHTKEYWNYAAITPKIEHDIKPRNQLQIDCIKYILDGFNKSQKIGAILGTGSGKTVVACFCACSVSVRTLFIAPTSGIKKQWYETLVNMFKVDPSRVKNVSGPQDFFNVKEDFVIISQASLASLNKKYDLEKIMKLNKFGLKVIDEVQMWFHNIVQVESNSNIRYNLYLTGTFGRSGEEENALYQKMFGDLSLFKEQQKKPTLFNPKPGNVYGMKPHMHVRMMWGHSGLSKEEIRAVSENMRYSERAGKWMRYGISIPAYTALTIPSDGTMTKFLTMVLKIIKMAEKEVTYGKTLILAPTIASVNVIRDYTEKMFPDKKIGTYHSKNTKQENEKYKSESDILISTVASCGTGFDWKGLAKLIVVQQFKSWILADQVSGRLRRRDDEKDTYMWDIVDADVKQLRAWANARADVLKRKSKSFKVIDID